MFSERLCGEEQRRCWRKHQIIWDKLSTVREFYDYSSTHLLWMMKSVFMHILASILAFVTKLLNKDFSKILQEGNTIKRTWWACLDKTPPLTWVYILMKSYFSWWVSHHEPSCKYFKYGTLPFFAVWYCKVSFSHLITF